MKRPLVLLATVLALVLAACSSDQPDVSATPASTPAATSTQAATPEPTPSQAAETPEPTESDGGTGSVITGSLSDALPAEVGGLAKQEVEGMDAFIGPMLQQQGVDAEEADFAFASYGEGEAAESLIVTAIRMPGVDQTELEMMARLISRSQAPGASGVEAESVTIGGKDVLRVSPPDEEQSVYVYLASDAFFSVISQSDELAEDLLSQLP